MIYKATIECVCTFTFTVEADSEEEAELDAPDLICANQPWEYRNIHSVHIEKCEVKSKNG